VFMEFSVASTRPIPQGSHTLSTPSVDSCAPDTLKVCGETLVPSQSLDVSPFFAGACLSWCLLIVHTCTCMQMGCQM
jgi:hypothetical protein